MNKILAFSLTFFILNFSFAQRIKTPQKAIDNEIYSVGDIIQIKSPTNNGRFQTIIYANRTSFSDVLNTVNTGSTIGTTSIKSQFADSNIKNFNGKISFFKLEELGNKKVTIAYIPYTSEVFLKIYLDNAISIGEVNSKNPNYKTIKSRDNSIDDNQVIAFNNDFDIEIIGAFGNTIDKTINLEFTIFNPLDLSQIVYFYKVNSMSSEPYSFITDFDGNTYKIKQIEFGTEKGLYSINSNIPSKIKLKAVITYSNVLTNIEKISVAQIDMANKNDLQSDYNYKYGTTILRNIPIIWNDEKVNIQNDEKDYSIKLFNPDLLFDIISVKGNKVTQKIVIEYYMINKQTNTELCAKPVNVTDIDGNMYKSTKVILGQINNCSLLPTDVKLKGSIELSNIPISINEISYLNFPFSYKKNGSIENGSNELRNLKIQWE